MASADTPEFDMKTEFNLCDFDLGDVGLTQLDDLPTQSLFAVTESTEHDVKPPPDATAASRFKAPILSESDFVGVLHDRIPGGTRKKNAWGV